jgi:hypothetical protein
VSEFVGKEFGARFGGADIRVIKDMVSNGMLGLSVCLSVCLSVSSFIVLSIQVASLAKAYLSTLGPNQKTAK